MQKEGMKKKAIYNQANEICKNMHIQNSDLLL